MHTGDFLGCYAVMPVRQLADDGGSEREGSVALCCGLG